MQSPLVAYLLAEMQLFSVEYEVRKVELPVVTALGEHERRDVATKEIRSKS